MNAKQILAHIDSSWAELAEAVGGIDRPTLVAAAEDGWSIKDHLVHLAAWELSLLALIEGRDRNTAMGIRDVDPSDIDGINDAVWKLHRNDSVDEVLRYFRDCHERLRATLATLTSTDLLLPYSHYQPNEADRRQAVVKWVAADTFEHYAEHKAWIEDRLPVAD
jgi:hypothetical protein